MFKQGDKYLQILGHKPPFKEALLAFYRKHNPERIKDLPKLLEKYRGNEGIMVKRLENQYKEKFPQFDREGMQ